MLQNLSPLRLYRIGLFVAVVVIGVILPSSVSPYLLRVVTTILVYACVAIGLNLILGYGGLISFGHAAFFGIGAYTVALLMIKLDWSFLAATGAGILLSVIMGALVGLTAWRVRGDYLALVTLGFVGITTLFMNNWVPLTGGPSGIPGVPLPTIFGYQLSASDGVYYLCLVTVGIVTGVCALISRSYFGRALLTIREDEIVARANGINVPAVKVTVFAIGAGIAGLAGAIQAASLGYVGPASFTLDQSILMVEIVVVGGMASTWGPLIGSTILVAATEFFRFAPAWRPAVFGAVMIVILIVRADGVASMLGLGRGSAGARKKASATITPSGVDALDADVEDDTERMPA
jgi:branched-chain amino acid transport system permease protein